MNFSNNYGVPTASEVAKYGLETTGDGVHRTFSCGGKPFRAALYGFDPRGDRDWEMCISKMYEDGIRIFFFLAPLMLCWDDPSGNYDFTQLDVVHKKLLKVAPEGLFIPHLYLGTPDWWDENNPDELLKFSGDAPVVPTLYEGPDTVFWRYQSKCFSDIKNPSVASELWKRDAGAALAAYMEFVWDKYPGHFPFFQPAYGTCGEWNPFGSYMQGQFGNFGFDLPMIAKFRTFLKQRYGSVAELRESWQDKTATFEKALPPSKEERLSTDWGSLKEPAKHRKLFDWTECYELSNYEAMDFFCKAGKEASPKPVISVIFAGGHLHLGASAYCLHANYPSMDLLFKQPHIDVLSTPNWYHNRAKGIASQGPVASLANHKIFIAQPDVRAMPPPAGVRTDPYECISDEEGAGWILRDCSYNKCSGQGMFYLYDFGYGWFQSEKVRKNVRLMRELTSRLRGDDWQQPEVAVVMDNESVTCVEGCAGYFRQFKDLVNTELPRSGFRFDLITLDDLFRMQPYKFYLFREAFYLPMKKRQALKDFLEKNKASAAWFHAAGLLDETGFNFKDGDDLVGVKRKAWNTPTLNSVVLNNKKSHFFNGMLLPFGSSETDAIEAVQIPLFSFEPDPSVEVLGTLQSFEVPGLGVRHTKNRFDIWSSTPLLPAAFWHNAAALAGCKTPVPSGIYFLSDEASIYLESPTATRFLYDIKCPLKDGITGEILTPDAVGRILVELEPKKPRCFVLQL